MSSLRVPHRRTKRIFAGVGVLAVLCCVVAPLALTAVCVAVDRFLGGRLGIICGIGLAGLAVVLWSLRARHRRATAEER